MRNRTERRQHSPTGSAFHPLSLDSSDEDDDISSKPFVSIPFLAEEESSATDSEQEIVLRPEVKRKPKVIVDSDDEESTNAFGAASRNLGKRKSFLDEQEKLSAPAVAQPSTKSVNPFAAPIKPLRVIADRHLTGVVRAPPRPVLVTATTRVHARSPSVSPVIAASQAPKRSRTEPEVVPVISLPLNDDDDSGQELRGPREKSLLPRARSYTAVTRVISQSAAAGTPSPALEDINQDAEDMRAIAEPDEEDMPVSALLQQHEERRRGRPRTVVPQSQPTTTKHKVPAQVSESKSDAESADEEGEAASSLEGEDWDTLAHPASDIVRVERNKQFYSALRLKSRGTFCVGEAVLVTAEDSRPWVAQITSIFREHDGPIMCALRWYYYGKDAPKPDGKIYGSKDYEVFFTHHEDLQRPYVIERKATVYIVSTMEGVEAPESDAVFYCCRYYDTKKQTLSTIGANDALLGDSDVVDPVELRRFFRDASLRPSHQEEALFMLDRLCNEVDPDPACKQIVADMVIKFAKSSSWRLSSTCKYLCKLWGISDALVKSKKTKRVESEDEVRADKQRSAKSPRNATLPKARKEKPSKTVKSYKPIFSDDVKKVMENVFGEASGSEGDGGYGSSSSTDSAMSEQALSRIGDSGVPVRLENRIVRALEAVGKRPTHGTPNLRVLAKAICVEVACMYHSMGEIETKIRQLEEFLSNRGMVGPRVLSGYLPPKIFVEKEYSELITNRTTSSWGHQRMNEIYPSAVIKHREKPCDRCYSSRVQEVLLAEGLTLGECLDCKNVFYVV